MMKVSDPILFGHMVRQFYKDVFDKHQQLFAKLGVNPNNGLGDWLPNLDWPWWTPAKVIV